MSDQVVLAASSDSAAAVAPASSIEMADLTKAPAAAPTASETGQKKSHPFPKYIASPAERYTVSMLMTTDVHGRVPLWLSPHTKLPTASVDYTATDPTSSRDTAAEGGHATPPSTRPAVFRFHMAPSRVSPQNAEVRYVAMALVPIGDLQTTDGIRAIAAIGGDCNEHIIAPVRLVANPLRSAVEAAANAEWDGSADARVAARGTHVIVASMRLVEWVMYSSYEDKATTEPGALRELVTVLMSDWQRNPLGIMIKHEWCDSSDGARAALALMKVLVAERMRGPFKGACTPEVFASEGDDGSSTCHPSSP